MKILMVCLGNICRSPIAEGVMQHLATEAGLDWQIDSAGTNSYHIGEPPHRYSQAVCKDFGIDISAQRARRFRKSNFESYDLIYVMATDVLDEMRELTGIQQLPENVKLFLDEVAPGANQSVTDPWYGDKSGYLPVYKQIAATCEVIIRKYGSD